MISRLIIISFVLLGVVGHTSLSNIISVNSDSISSEILSEIECELEAEIDIEGSLIDQQNNTVWRPDPKLALCGLVDKIEICRDTTPPPE